VVAVPLVVVLLVLTRVLGDGVDDGGSPAAEVSGAPSQQRADLPPLPVQVPPVTPEADASCPALMSALPLELAGESSRPVQSDSPFAYAWGDPPVVLVCGVDRPAGLEPTSGLRAGHRHRRHRQRTGHRARAGHRRRAAGPAALTGQDGGSRSSWASRTAWTSWEAAPTDSATAVTPTP
jgi:hypothetical protein